MARPTTYAQARVDTKVRLRPDHRDLLKAMEDETGQARNRIIERALDEFFGITSRTKAPRLAKAAADQALGRPVGSSTARQEPRLPRLGEEQARAAEAKSKTPVITQQAPKTKHRPRRSV